MRNMEAIIIGERKRKKKYAAHSELSTAPRPISWKGIAKGLGVGGLVMFLWHESIIDAASSIGGVFSEANANVADEKRSNTEFPRDGVFPSSSSDYRLLGIQVYKDENGVERSRIDMLVKHTQSFSYMFGTQEGAFEYCHSYVMQPVKGKNGVYRQAIVDTRYRTDTQEKITEREVTDRKEKEDFVVTLTKHISSEVKRIKDDGKDTTMKIERDNVVYTPNAKGKYIMSKDGTIESVSAIDKTTYFLQTANTEKKLPTSCDGGLEMKMDVLVDRLSPVYGRLAFSFEDGTKPSYRVPKSGSRP